MHRIRVRFFSAGQKCPVQEAIRSALAGTPWHAEIRHREECPVVALFPRREETMWWRKGQSPDYRSRSEDIHGDGMPRSVEQPSQPKRLVIDWDKGRWVHLPPEAVAWILDWDRDPVSVGPIDFDWAVPEKP